MWNDYWKVFCDILMSSFTILRLGMRHTSRGPEIRSLVESRRSSCSCAAVQTNMVSMCHPITSYWEIFLNGPCPSVNSDCLLIVSAWSVLYFLHSKTRRNCTTDHIGWNKVQLTNNLCSKCIIKWSHLLYEWVKFVIILKINHKKVVESSFMWWKCFIIEYT